MCSDKKSQEPSYKWPVMPIVVNTEDQQLSTPIIGRLCQDEKCQSTRCFKKKSPVRPKYKYGMNCQSGSSSEKENPDTKKRQMIYEANEAPSTEVVKKLQVKQITSTGTNEGPNEGPNEDTNESTKEVIQFKNQANRDTKTQLEL